MTNQERVTQITMLAEQLRLSEEMTQSVLNDINRQMAERQTVIEGLEQKVVALEAENNQLLEVCREFAARNPKWMCDGKEQDPLGAHALLVRLAAARSTQGAAMNVPIPEDLYTALRRLADHQPTVVVTDEEMYTLLDKISALEEQNRALREALLLTKQAQKMADDALAATDPEYARIAREALK